MSLELAISFQASQADRALQLQAEGMEYDASLYYAVGLSLLWIFQV